MEQCLLSYKSAQLSYYRMGKGPRLVLCFHGYGESGLTYAFLEKYGAEQYTFLAPDLPYHGQTSWKENNALDPAALVEICQAFIKQEEEKQGKAITDITLLGFSLGGRVALMLYQLMAPHISKMVLLAPDGLKVNFWYWLSTQTWLGSRLFAFTMKHPGWFFALLRAFNRLGWVNSSIFKFVKHYIGNAEVRQLLYNRWYCLRRIKPKISRIRQLLQQHVTPVHIVYGKHDRIILPSRGYKFRKGLEAHCSIEIIESGHQVLHEKHAGLIMDRLMN